MVTAVTMLVKMPSASDTAKPRTGRRKEIEDRRRDEHRHIGVDDGREGAVEAGVERGQNRAPECASSRMRS